MRGQGFPRRSGSWSEDVGWDVVEMMVIAAGAEAAVGTKAAKAGTVGWCELGLV